MRDALRSIIGAHGKLSVPVETLGDEADLFAAGMDSLAVVTLMMAIEDRFGVEMPDDMLNRSTFTSIAALERSLRTVIPA